MQKLIFVKKSDLPLCPMALIFIENSEMTTFIFAVPAC